MATVDCKQCSHCGNSLPLSHFSKARGYKDGYRGQCRSCRSSIQQAYHRANPHVRAAWTKSVGYERSWRNSQYKQLYGITLRQYDCMVKQQDGRCAICGTQPKHRLHVDHCHATGEIRGLLCATCNTLVGQLGDNYSDAKQATQLILDYLSEHALTEPVHRRHLPAGTT